MPATSILEQIASELGVPAKDLLKETLQREQSIEGAALALGIYPNSVYRAMQKYGLVLTRIVMVEEVQSQPTSLRRKTAKGQ